MKNGRKGSYLVTLILILAGSVSHSQICKSVFDIPELERSHHQARLDLRSNELTRDFDVKYHRLEWQVDPSEQYISGRVLTRLVVLSDDFEYIHFDMSTNLEVNEVMLEGDILMHRFLPDDVLQLDLMRPYNTGDTITVEIEYSGSPKETGFQSFRASEHNGVPIVSTLSEPYGAKEWWPCKQDLNDKIDSVDIIVTVPVGYKVASNGILQTVVEDSLTSTHHWKHRYPIAAYLIAIGVTNYIEYSNYVSLENGDTLEVLNYVYPEDFAQAMSDTRYVVDMISLFNDLFGLYPFSDEKYGHAQFGWGGGMEHQTMSFMSNFSYELQAHELAHQWFGDKVTCGSWKDIWLNEGFATYLTGLTIENLTEPRNWEAWKAGNLARIVREPDGSVFVTDTTDIYRIFNGRLSYSKGAYVLHMLRWIMGDQAFFSACRNYLDDPELAYGYARTGDLMGHMEDVSGKSLEYFFDDWIYGEGYPSYRAIWTRSGDSIQVKLDQTQSHPSVDFFELPVPIHIHGDGHEQIEVLDHRTNGQPFMIHVPFDIDSITIDDDLWLISFGNEVIEDMGTHSIDHSSAKVMITPNPFTGTLSVKGDPRHSCQIEVWSSDGKRFFRGCVRGDLRIETGKWPPGMYVVLIQNGSTPSMMKVVRE